MIHFIYLYRLAHSVRGMLAFGIFISHGVACYVAIELTWNSYFVDKISNERNKWICEYVVRTVVAMITCKLKMFTFKMQQLLILMSKWFDLIFLVVLLAVAIPKLGLFISLFGALCLSLLGLTLPALIETLVFLNVKSGMSKTVMIIKNSLIILFGLFALVIGTFTSLDAIFETLSEAEWMHHLVRKKCHSQIQQIIFFFFISILNKTFHYHKYWLQMMALNLFSGSTI